MTWKDFVYKCVVEFCEEQGKRTFELQQLWASHKTQFENFSANNNNVEAKVRQQLQFLRDDGLLNFLDRRGTYTLKGVILKGELEDDKVAEISRSEPQKREYLIETYARNHGWVSEAKNKHGVYCLCRNCNNTFEKPDKTPYIEVHHIISLADGGEDSLWNLAVLCAHHHRMAHFASDEIRSDLQKFLLKEVQQRLNG